MAFRLRNDAERWFQNVEKSVLKTKFDMYYFCLVVGLASARRSDVDESNSREFVQDFISDYRPFQKLIVGLLATAELERQGIGLAEREAVTELFKDIFAAGSTRSLSDEAFRLLNRYASGGFDFMAESIDVRPSSAEDFLLEFPTVLEAAFGSST